MGFIPALPTEHFLAASDAVAVAGVHATIIAIFTGFLVGYLGIVLNWMHSIRQGLIDRANSVGEIEVRNTYKHETLEDDAYDGADSSSRSQHLANIDAITKGQPAWIVDSQSEGAERPVDTRVPPPNATIDRVKYLVATLSLLRRTSRG